MSKCGPAVTAALVILSILTSTSAVTAAPQTWRVDGATVSLSLDSDHLANLGLTIADERRTAVSNLTAAEVIEGELYSYRMSSGTELEFRTDNGGFQAFSSGLTESLRFEGGLAFRTMHPHTKAALSPAFLYDFAVEIDPAAELDLARIVTQDPSLSSPLAVRSTALAFFWDVGELAIMRGDLVITKEWAEFLGQPELANQWVGGFDLRVRATPVDGPAIAPTITDAPADLGRAAFLDVTLGQLYGLGSHGREGSYPNGMSGLSAATTSCNSGDVIVPWEAAMQEDHPTIGLAMYRLSASGSLEMIGQNQLKHGWYALSSDQCGFGCSPSDGSYLGVGCSDTYSAGNNSNRYDLGPRSEVNPVTGEWVACGSFFDEPSSPDGDCDRDYFGTAPDDVWHRLEVHDSDLGNPGASYFYEGEYIVRGDRDLQNSIGWRECTTSWSGSSWLFSTVGGGLTPTYGPLIQTWGDEQVAVTMPDHDGNVILATQVTDLGGGQWHYEYALYNWWCRRGVRSFSVPTGGATLSNIGFHDIDQDAGNEWTVDQSGGAITWSTDDYATDPDANALYFQTQFNFRFDANVAPEPGTATLGAFLPGAGATALANVQTPGAGVTSVLAVAELGDLRLVSEPNPFSDRTEVRFSLAQGRNVQLSVVDVTGRSVRVLLNGEAPAGSHRIAWDGRNSSGEELASGVYFFRLDAGDQSRTVKATLLR